jgi:hypothetical protein
MIQQQLHHLAGKHLTGDRSLNRLQPRHIQDDFSSSRSTSIDHADHDDGGGIIINDEGLFEEFAQAVCLANTIPRKELFEAWGMALYVHDHFPASLSRRIADLACGHGLVSWALLLMDASGERTAVCIDRSMPKSSERVAESMTRRFPALSDRWEYVEGDVLSVVGSSSTLLVGVHCCGMLSDHVINLAISSNAPLALVPCCHTRKCLPSQSKSNVRSMLDAANMTLADFIDQSRIQTLEKAGYAVEEQRIPRSITPLNRIILATPPSLAGEITLDETQEVVSSCTQPIVGRRSSGMPPIPVASKVNIPVANTPEARAIVRLLSGRAAANCRKRLPPPHLSVCLFLPDPETFSMERLNQLSNIVVATAAEEKTAIHITTQVEPVSEVFLNPKTGRYSQTFRIHYNVVDDTGTVPQVSKQHAKELHIALCRQIPLTFEGVSVRQMPT